MDELTSLLTDLVFWLGVLAVSPMAFTLSKVLSGLLWAKLFPVRKVEIRYKRADGTVTQAIVKLDKSSPIVAQLNAAGGCNGK